MHKAKYRSLLNFFSKNAAPIWGRCLFEKFVFLMKNSLLKSYKNYTQNFCKIFIKIKRPHQYYISIQISGKTPSQFKILRNHIQFFKKSNQKFYQPLKLKSCFKMFLIKKKTRVKEYTRFIRFFGSWPYTLAIIKYLSISIIKYL